MPITYLKGDATKVQVTGGLRINAHIANNRGGWGSGYVVALSKRWSEPEAEYRKWAASGNNFELGQVQMVPVEDEYGRLYVANMVAQDGFVGPNRPRAVDYEAVGECLHQLDEWIKSLLFVKNLMWQGRQGVPRVTIHMPRIGAGLGGGTWSIIEDIICSAIGHHEVFVYDLE